ncbi:chalcone isomerase family protein [Shewanella sp. C32]|uniref:Chalcone isomerase family protein n=1 Tax=Shewanella electrica TaxID=515560 RepID=A0ABT2FG94_9GAMM|nr:chalcone isomerase family protein [Shewanella electrica]MCH1925133.1 chalcone isomerase family protein [Shewanella electrica]MCS4554957.1 chalcone isomerase family protein [Shewanella electrica]
MKLTAKWANVVAGVALLLSVSANAAASATWTQWPSVGQASLSWLWFDVYHSTLRTPSGQYDGQQAPLALQIRYQREISAQELLDATSEQWQKLGYSTEQIAPWLKQLSAIFPNVTEGDQLVYVSAGEAGDFYYQAKHQSGFKLLGQVTEPALNQAFIAIWLSPQTEYPKLRQQLIGAS